MINDGLIRRVLAAAALFNLGGAFLFAFPSSPIGQWIGLPGAVPAVYCAMLAWFVLLFGAMYAWLARQEEIDRAMVAFGAIGKASAFAIVAIFWLLGQVGGLMMVAITGDLIFAAVFAWWLVATK